MIRTQVSLTEAQMRRLRWAAARRGISMAHIIRDAIEAYVPDDRAQREQRVARVLELAGRFDSGLSDISERHDDYLAQGPAEW